jgi:hypothetical protein
MTYAFTDNAQIDELIMEDAAPVEEFKFLFNGFHTRQRRQVVLGYMAPTAQEAWDLCARLNPDLIVINWGEAENFI